MESKLFTPASIGPITLRNRTIRSAAFESMCSGNGPTQMLADYHKSVAAGGIGMTTLAYAAVTRSGLSFERQLWLRPEIVPELHKITDDIHSLGAKVSIQIGHCGNMSHRSICGQRPISASSGFNLYSPTFVHGMSRAEIDEVATAFGTAVNLAREAGFDAVEIHAGHGYLIDQFLSPYTNHRHDEFGGSLDNRMNFMRLCMEQVMKAAGNDMAVIVKTNMRDGFRGGNDIEEGLVIAKELVRLGAHALVLTGGFVSRAPMYVMRGHFPKQAMAYYMSRKMWWLAAGVRVGGQIVSPTVPYEDCYFLEDAKRFRAEITSVPLIYVGGVCSRESAEKVLDSGFDFFQMARALIVEPDFVNRMKEAGDENHCAGCTHSNYCVGRMYTIDMKCHQCLGDEKLPRRVEREIERNEYK